MRAAALLARPQAPQSAPDTNSGGALVGVPPAGLPAAVSPLAVAARVRPFRPSLRVVTFVAFVLLPTAVAAAYWFAIAADQYVAEFRFALNTAEPPRLDPLALLAGNATNAPATLESQILVQYITSRAIVDRIGASLDIRQMFSRPRADWWARLSPAAPIEAVVRYWKGQVDPFYDPADGTVTVRVRAFAPRDALRLAQAVVAACEALVNDLSLRARRDTLRHAESDLAQDQRRLTAVLGRLRAFRDKEGMIDPARTAAATGRLATRLEGEVVNDNAELATLRTYMHADAPSVRVLQARIRALTAQRRALAREMTDPGRDGAAAAADARGAGGNKTLSHVLSAYEELQSERQFAETAYQHALRALDQARAEADRRHVFVASFVPPSLPEEPLYPRRWRAVGTVALIAFALWGIGGLAVQSIRDHLI